MMAESLIFILKLNCWNKLPEEQRLDVQLGFNIIAGD